MARLDFPSLALGAAAAACALLFWERRKRQIKATFQAIVNPPDEPMSLLKAWLAENEAVDGVAARFVVLATSSPEEGATARTLLLQKIDSTGGLVFGTSPGSLKGRSLAQDDRAEVVMRWGNQQVRCRGRMRKGSASETESAFAGLPVGAQLGLPLLEQGAPIDDAAYAKVAAAYEEKAMLQQSNSNPCPHDRYSAYVLELQTVEFYSGGHAGYVNDRFLFIRDGAAWKRIRLQG